MHSFSTGQSLASKRDNWDQIAKFFKRARISIGRELIRDTINAVEGASVEIFETLYTAFTQRQVQQLKLPEPEAAGPDSPGLPMSSASGTFKRQFNRGGAARERDGDGANALGQALTPGSKPVSLRAANIPSVQFGNVRVSRMDDSEFLQKSLRAQRRK